MTKDNSINIETLVVGPIQTNCYLVWADNSKDAMVIDPGGDAERILKTVDEKGLRVDTIVLTHGHWDHVTGCARVAEATGATVMAHQAISDTRGCKVDRQLTDGDTVKLGTTYFQVIHTPGHEPGSICLYGGGALFAGDLIFSGSVGRTDFQGGDLDELLKSIIVRLADLPDDTKVYSGHGPSTTLGKERRTNPYFKLARERLGGKP